MINNTAAQGNSSTAAKFLKLFLKLIDMKKVKNPTTILDSLNNKMVDKYLEEKGGETLNKEWYFKAIDGNTTGIYDGNGIVAKITHPHWEPTTNAQRIVTAVNSYDDMLEALKEAQNALHYLTNQPSKETPLYKKTFKKIKAAIAKATNNQ